MKRSTETAELRLAMSEVAVLARAPAPLEQYTELRLVKLPPYHRDRPIEGGGKVEQRRESNRQSTRPLGGVTSRREEELRKPNPNFVEGEVRVWSTELDGAHEGSVRSFPGAHRRDVSVSDLLPHVQRQDSSVLDWPPPHQEKAKENVRRGTREGTLGYCLTHTLASPTNDTTISITIDTSTATSSSTHQNPPDRRNTSISRSPKVYRTASQWNTLLPKS
ncbi:hypothetical protein BHM03_00037213 [Ensete ventricosum]|nr:hypothetical protein BHM03_00037213 [Ensete ventricosum]